MAGLDTGWAMRSLYLALDRYGYHIPEPFTPLACPSTPHLPRTV